MSFAPLSSVLVLAALTTSALAAHDDDPQLMGLTSDELKSAYLLCEHAAMRTRLDTAQVMQCSVIYEALKRRAFDGDFEKLLAWFRSHLPAPGFDESQPTLAHRSGQSIGDSGRPDPSREVRAGGPSAPTPDNAVKLTPSASARGSPSR
jgi:hypothetical protein